MPDLTPEQIERRRMLERLQSIIDLPQANRAQKRRRKRALKMELLRLRKLGCTIRISKPGDPIEGRQSNHEVVDD